MEAAFRALFYFGDSLLVSALITQMADGFMTGKKDRLSETYPDFVWGFVCLVLFLAGPPTTAFGSYGVAMISRLLKMIGLFCQRAL